MRTLQSHKRRLCGTRSCCTAVYFPALVIIAVCLDDRDSNASLQSAGKTEDTEEKRTGQEESRGIITGPFVSKDMGREGAEEDCLRERERETLQKLIQFSLKGRQLASSK